MTSTAGTPVAAALERIQRMAFATGGIGALLLVAGFCFDRARFFQAYLCAYLFVLGPADGESRI